MATLMNVIREFNTLSTIKEIFGDTEFTKKQYDYVRHITGNQLLSLDSLRDSWSGMNCFKIRAEAMFGNALDEEVYVMAEKPAKYGGRMQTIRSIPVKEIENLPKKVRKYIKENMVEKNKYRTETHGSNYRNFFSVNEEKMDYNINILKNEIKARTSDAEIANLENQLRALQNRIATLLKIREEIED